MCVCVTCDHMILIKRAGATLAATKNIFASSTAKQSQYNKETNNNNNSELYMSSLFLLLCFYQFFCLRVCVCERVSDAHSGRLTDDYRKYTGTADLVATSAKSTLSLIRNSAADKQQQQQWQSSDSAAVC